MIRLQPWPTRSSAASAVLPPSRILYFQTIWSSAHAQLSSGFLDTIDVRGAVALGLIAQDDGADFDVGCLVIAAALSSSGGTGGAAGSSVSGGTTAARLNTIEAASRIPISFFMCVVPPCYVCIKTAKMRRFFLTFAGGVTHFVTLQDPL